MEINEILTGDAVALAIVASRIGTHGLAGSMTCKLPGMPPKKYRWGGSVLVPEDCAAFFDDVSHTLNVERRLWELGLEDLCAYQPALI